MAAAPPLQWFEWLLPPPRFDADLEHDYLHQWRLPQTLRLQRLSGWAATMMYVSALVADGLLGNRLRDPFIYWTFAASSISMTAMLALGTYLPRLIPRAYDVAFATLLVNGIVLILITALTRQSGNPFPLAWTLILLIYTLISAGMPYRMCVPLGIFLGIFDFVVALELELPALELTDHILLVTSTIVTGVIACSALERGDRLSFMRARQMLAYSYNDELTSLRNRRYLFEEGGHRISHAKREDQPIALLMIDIDHFKRYNDSLGHPAGDRCLRQTAALLASCARRPLDITARLGGEEFAVLLFSCTKASALLAAEALRAHIEAAGISHSTSPLKVLTISIGVAASDKDPITGLHLDSLLQAADVALYRAKEGGRNRVSG